VNPSVGQAWKGRQQDGWTEEVVKLSTTGPPRLQLLALLLILVGGVCFPWFLVSLGADAWFVVSSPRADGVVQAVRSPGAGSFVCEVHFRSESGREFTFNQERAGLGRATRRRRGPPCSVGDRVRVVYDAKDPAGTATTSGRAAVGDAIGVFVTGGLLAGGLWLRKRRL
jgi:hypothetical protein